MSYFNSHPHEEDDNCSQFPVNNPMNFNSHPHEEDDCYGKELYDVINISTHILTRRMTWLLICPISLSVYFNSHPHEEDDHPL